MTVSPAPAPGDVAPHDTPRGAGAATRVFVYGTLRPGGRFWHQALAGRVAAVGPTVRLPGLQLWDGPGFPLAVGGGTVKSVVGEVVSIVPGHAAGVMADLDRIEAVGELFDRVDRDGVWVYVATASGLSACGAERIASGDWFDVDPEARAAWEQLMGVPYRPLLAPG